MSTSLTITAAASLPDRGTNGLQIDFASGNDGAYLLHELPEDAAVLHVRLMLAPATASGGAVRLAGGHDAAGEQTWWLDYDADERRVQLELATGQTLTAELNALPWHCIEVGFDTSLDVARLWINGLEHDAVQGSFAALASRSVWLGGVFKDTALTGALHVDEWVIGEAYIGPVVVEPVSGYADDPRRWLVIYNADVPDAVTWAEAYRAARGVPFANLLGLSLPTQETIDGDGYADLAASVNGYLASSALISHVMGVLVGYGVPGYVDFDAGYIDAVPALMHSEHLDATVTGNAEVADAPPTRPTHADMNGRRMTARMDGPTLEAALALIDRAEAQINGGIAGGEQSRLWFDPFAGDPDSSYEWWRQQMVGWAASYDRQRLRLPMEVSGDLADPDQPEVTFASIHDDAFFWGWPASSVPAPPSGFFDAPAGPRVCCLQLHHLDATATTLRSATPTNWVDTAIDAGYAAAVGTSRPHSLSNTPYVRPFFDALRRGWTLAEAWYVSLPIQREGQHLVGDPLLRTRFPQAGWDVYGPATQLERLTVDTPTAALPLHQLEQALAEAELPGEGDEAVYLVRQRDGQGRSEGGLAMTRVVREGDAYHRAAMPPTWPDHANWRPRIEQGQVHLVAMWDRPLRDARLATVSLLAEVDDDAETELVTVEVESASADGANVVRFATALPAERARYRWRFVSTDGAVQHTPMSMWVRPVVASEQTLMVWETQR